MTYSQEDEVDNFPCGCRGRMVNEGPKGKRLVIEVSPNCKWDAPKIGKVLDHVRYEAQRPRRKA